MVLKIEDAQWQQLLQLLKRVCGKRQPTVVQIEWAMDKLRLPDEMEIDFDVLVLELSCFELDAEQEQIRQIEKKYKKLAKQAHALPSTDDSTTISVELDKRERWRQDNETLVARVDQITG